MPDFMYRVLSPMIAKTMWYRLHVEQLEQEAVVISLCLREKMCYVVAQKPSK